MKYTTEQKRELVMRYQNGERVEHICAERGIARSTFYSWIKPFQTTVTQTGVLVTPREYDHLQKRVKKLEAMIEVLKMVNCTVSAPLKEKLAALESLYGQYSVYVLCEALEVVFIITFSAISVMILGICADEQNCVRRFAPFLRRVTRYTARIKYVRFWCNRG